MEATMCDESLAGRDFDQWMDWSGEADSSGARSGSSFATIDNDNANASASDVHGNSSYPVSPSTTANGDTVTGLQLKALGREEHLSSLPTPRHSSSSPEIPPLPELRLSGDTLRDPSPVRNSRPILKRKFSPSEATPTIPWPENPKPASKKRPHNVIEKRYRANLNEKIAELRDSVPSLRVSKKPVQDADRGEDDDDDDLDGLTPTNKLNKASILTKAVEYIRHLELRNKKLDDENVALKERLHTLDKVLSSGGNSSAERAAAFTSKNAVEEPASPLSDSNAVDNPVQAARHPPEGLIPVPESWRQLRAQQPQEHYGHIYEGSVTSGRKWPTKLMLGSLAGLMIMEGFSESEQGSESKEKGLFGIPLEFLDGYWFLRSPRLYLAAFVQYCKAGGVLPLLKGFTALTILAFFVFTYLFNSKPPIPKEEDEPVKPQRAPSLASPLEVRRQAWLTSMQVLKLPRHSFFPEWLAVTSEWLRYTWRLIFGDSSYSWMTGRSADDELARVKAWDIAMDAQLAGGDPEISRSRLVLSMFAAGTLPRTPARLMLKALHCRVLFRSTGGWKGIATRWADKIAAFLANYQWMTARRLCTALPPSHPDALPRHLAMLLAQDCHEILSDAVIQRAFNLMYGRPTSQDADAKDDLMDVVVEDHAVHSPLDAVAAWWSSQELRKALLHSLEPDFTSQESFQRHLRASIDSAPPSSAAHTRALAVHAAFFKSRRSEYKSHIMATLPAAPPRNASQIPRFIDSSTPESAIPEISSILHCVSVMELVDNLCSAPEYCHWKEEAMNLFTFMPVDDPQDLSLLSFAPAYHVLQEVACDRSNIASPKAYEGVLRKLSIWAHTEKAHSTPLPEMVLATLDDLCIEMKDLNHRRRPSNMSNDTGYCSMEEGEMV
jgi:hypothetical protein